LNLSNPSREPVPTNQDCSPTRPRLARASRAPSGRSLALAMALLGLHAALPAVAYATPSESAAASDKLTVKLKNGAEYRGELVERVPGDHVTIKLATGEVKRFEWAELVDASDAAKPKADPDSAPSSGDEGKQAPDDASDADGRAKKPERKVSYDDPSERVSSGSSYSEGSVVFLDSDQGADLERHIGSSSLAVGGRELDVEHWERVCTAPCNRSLPAGEYRLHGEGLRSSETFRLTGGSAHVSGHLGSKYPFTMGWTLALTGAAVAVTFALLAATTQPTTATDRFGQTTVVGSDPRGTYWVTAGIAGAVAAVGVVLWLTNLNSLEVQGGSASIGLHIAKGITLTPAGITF
jgi:hypothetical protein